MLLVEVAFRGSAADKELAGKLFNLMSIHGRFMADNAPIQLPVKDIVEFLAKMGTTVTESEVLATVKKNDAVFAVAKDGDGAVSLSTTRTGKAPRGVQADGAHSFVERFMKPLPKPEKPAYTAPVRAPEPQWAPSDVVVAAEETLLAAEAALQASAAEESVPAEDSAEVTVAPQARTVTVTPPPAHTYAEVEDTEVARAISERLSLDPRVATFGDQWMLEERVPRFGRNELRRIREYIQEQEQPLTDDVLAQDVLGGRPGSAEFDQLRFAVNFRLSREHRDFDFLGTANQRFWSVSALAPLGTTRRKPNEIGSDYRQLNDGLPEEPQFRSRESLDRILTFYEYQLGLMPYDAEMQALLPAPLLPNQRTAVLTFECPQSYTTYLVELRYPAPNRGGFIVGLDDFYNENLVPGALISISRTDNDGHYIVKYIAAETRQVKLLELEDRRQRYVFRPATYACGVIEEQVLTEDLFPGLAQEKPLDDKARRRPEQVISTSFERIGHKLESGTGYAASFNELFAVSNIERPFSDSQLRAILETDESGAFSRDPELADGYTYVPNS